MPEQRSEVDLMAALEESLRLSDGYSYVREHYPVDPRPGQCVTVDGEEGVVATGRGDQYIYVRFPARSASGSVSPCHPTWRLVLGEGRSS